MGAKKGLIFGAAPCSDWTFLRTYQAWPDVVIAADGGLKQARDAGFRPDAYVGDDDSGGHPEPSLCILSLPREKDLTDLEAACVWAIEHGVQELLLAGCSGGRLDHQLAALGLLETAARQGIRAVLLDSDNRAECLLPGHYTRRSHGYRYFSLIPLDQTLEETTISGAKYPLHGKDVCRGSSLTVSNEFLDDTVELSFTGGCCLFIETDSLD